MEFDFKKALNYSFWLLKYRARSQKEIIERLKRKEYPASVAKKVIEYLLEHDFLNDAQFSRMFVDSAKNKSWGIRRIENALKKFGVAKEIYQEFLPNKQETRQKLRELIERKSQYYKGKKNAYQKLVRFLATRGFVLEDIFREIEEYKRI